MATNMKLAQLLTKKNDGHRSSTAHCKYRTTVLYAFRYCWLLETAVRHFPLQPVLSSTSTEPVSSTSSFISAVPPNVHLFIPAATVADTRLVSPVPTNLTVIFAHALPAIVPHIFRFVAFKILITAIRNFILFFLMASFSSSTLCISANRFGSHFWLYIIFEPRDC